MGGDGPQGLDEARLRMEAWAKKNPGQAAKLASLGALMDGVPVHAPEGAAGDRARRRAQRSFVLTMPARGIVLILVGLALSIGWLVFREATLHQGHRDLGSVAIPGSGTVRLDEGDVQLYYERDEFNRHGPTAPDGLSVTIAPDDGGPALRVQSLDVSAIALGSGNRAFEPIGHVEVPRAGTYTVATSVTGPIPSSFHPAITLGPRARSPLVFVPVEAIVIFGVFLAGAVVIRRRAQSGT